MPTYEYRCPEGHTFELFQRMSDPPAAECQICGKSPVTKVLYPAAVHFKGSGFYSTDYGRGGRKRDSVKDGESPSTSEAKSSEKSETKDSSKDSSKDPGKSDTKKSDS
jgi:putative FmdB family regulatory protein